jgi:endonuclease/exonuclease/phosphatase family metal-dependent hydrolase
MKMNPRKIGKIVLALLIVLLLFVIMFYFWGSASKRSEANEATLYFNENAKSKRANDTLCVMTYNIGYLSGMTNNLAVERDKELFETNQKRLQALLKDLRPDVCCFQEIDFHSSRSYYVDQLGEISKELNYPFSSRVINWDKNYVPFPYWPPSMQFGEILSGQAIASVYPIKKNESLLLQKGDYPFYYNAFYLDRLAQVNILNIGDRELLVINVHLEAWDARAREIQADQLIALFNKYEKDYPILLMGDFNSTPPGAEKPYMIEQTIEKILAIDGMKSVISDSLYLSDEKDYFTFNTIAPYIKIDYIFYNEKKIKLIDARVVKEAKDISDHFPLVAKILLLDQ